jgi:hypothetical protein
MEGCCDLKKQTVASLAMQAASNGTFKSTTTPRLVYAKNENNNKTNPAEVMYSKHQIHHDLSS